MTTSPATTAAAGATTRTLTANSTLAFVLASMVNVTLHESAHAVAGLAQGLTPTITTFAVDYAGTATPRQQITTALAGPFFSLVMGLVMLVVARNWGTGLVRLFWMWLPFMGIMNFVGYLFIAPFASAGDTGQALTLMGAPGPVFILVGMVGAGGQFLLARRFATEVKRYAADVQQERRLAYFPWLIGTPILIVLTAIEALLFGAPAEIAILVVVASLAAGVFAPMQFIFNKSAHNTFERLALKRVNVTGLAVVTVVAALLVALAAVGGVRIG